MVLTCHALVPEKPGPKRSLVRRYDFGMPADTVIGQARPVTRSELESDLRSLGVRAGGILMVHTRMSAIGWVIGGSQTVVEALLGSLARTAR